MATLKYAFLCLALYLNAIHCQEPPQTNNNKSNTLTGMLAQVNTCLGEDGHSLASILGPVCKALGESTIFRVVFYLLLLFSVVDTQNV